MIPFKDRNLELEQKIKVYRNLRTGGFSILDHKTGLVVAHANTITIVNAEFKVNEKGRQRVLREKQKNVHAYVCGTFFPNYAVKSIGKEVSYNPYEQSSFTYRHNNEEITEASYVVCRNDKVFIH